MKACFSVFAFTSVTSDHSTCHFTSQSSVLVKVCVAHTALHDVESTRSSIQDTVTFNQPRLHVPDDAPNPDYMPLTMFLSVNHP